MSKDRLAEGLGEKCEREESRMRSQVFRLSNSKGRAFAGMRDYERRLREELGSPGIKFEMLSDS